MSRTYEQLEPVISALDDRIKTNLGAFPTDTAEGSIASFPDGADDIPLKSLVVNIDPVQDLHGQDAPYPAGGGKNLLDPSLLIDQASWNNIPVKVKPNTAYTMSTNKGTQADTGLALYFNNTNTQGGTDSTAVRSGHPITITSTSEGYVYVSQRVVSGEDSFQNYKCQIEEGSTATAYAPYENICPISGWTGMTVNASGKNLCQNTFGSGSATGITYTTNDDGTITFNGTTNGVFERTIGTLHLKKDVTYVINGNSYNSSNVRIQLKFVGGGSALISQYNNQDASYTPTVDGDYILTIAIINQTLTNFVVSPMIRLASITDDTYEPYNGQTIPIDWQTEAGTVYGGHLDVLTGVLTVDRAMVTLDEDDITNVIVEGQICRVLVASGKISTFDSYRDGVCNKAVIKTSWGGVTGDTNAIAINLPTSNQFVVNSAFGTTLQEIKSFVGTGLQICTYIATPIEIQLTPHEVNSLLGQNNIFADTGDSSVEYRADTKLYIERLTEPDADMIADSNIVSGQYFMVGNTLYKATANIASGSAVIEGTNCTQKSLSEALNEINQ